MTEHHCKTHHRIHCPDTRCRDAADNAGLPSINTDGNLAMGLGSGLAVDLSDGSLGIQIAPGITVDLDGS